jgi:predicted transcriptional regulator of viral defense system
MHKILNNLSPEIISFFDEAKQKVYKQSELTGILKKNQGTDWKLSQHLTTPSFIKKLLGHPQFKKIFLQPANESPVVTRFIWGNVSPYEMALSLNPNSYLCHGTAVFLHGLNDQIPRVVYVNKEQSQKLVNKTNLTQEGIDKAFAGAQRTSLYEIAYKNNRIFLVRGKNTDNLDVSQMKGENGEALAVTKIERTLIDIAVRPAYAGGVYQVLAAYEGARGLISISKITKLLEKMSFHYPYHQAIGFYLKKAGYPSKSINTLKGFGLEFDFYLDYGISRKNNEYDEEWRLFYPKGF